MKKLLIKNVLVQNPFVEPFLSDILVENGIIKEINSEIHCEDTEIIDGSNKILTPGLIDRHTHGGYGCNFNTCSENELQEYLIKIKRHGVVGIVPTIMTDDIKVINNQIKLLKKIKSKGAKILGIHLEGPFINSLKSGIHPQKHILLPSIENLAKIDTENVKILTYAPELDTDGSFLEELLKRQIIPSIGHSNATYVQASKVFENGVNQITHLFNALPPIHHREPGIVTAALNNDNIYVEIIADLEHIHKSIIEIILLYINGMPLFDSVCHSLSTLAAGGLSPQAAGIGEYNNPVLIWIITVFMFLAGVNFALQYRVIVQKQFKAIFSNTEFMVYLLIFLGFSAMLVYILVTANGYNISNAIRDSMFQVISILTSTGFASVDFAKWTTPAQVLLFVLMLVGASAGSASGGIKVVRVVIVMKYLWREIVAILHPKAIIPIKLDKIAIPVEILKQTIAFVIFYFIILILSSIMVSILEGNIITGITGSATTLGNIGPGFAQIGPYSNFDNLSNITKIIFIFNMLIGRLELIPFLAMLHGDFWKFSLKKES